MLTDSMRNELQALKVRLTTSLDHVNGLLEMEEAQSNVDTEVTTQINRGSNSKDVANAAYQIILNHGRPMHREPLLTELEDSGMSIRPDTQKTKKLTALSAILSKDARFKSLGRGSGLWGVDHDHVTREEGMNGQHNVQIPEPSHGRIFE